MRNATSVLGLTLLLASGLTAQTVNYTGTAPPCIDDRDGDISASIEWYSDMQGGPLATGQNVAFDLNGGTHVITATCMDAAGNAAPSLTTTVTVEIPDTTPPTFDGSIIVVPTQTSGRLEVTPDAAMMGAYGMRAHESDGVARNAHVACAYASGGEPCAPGAPAIASLNLDHVEATFWLQAEGATLTPGREIVIFRLDTEANEPIMAAAIANENGSKVSYGKVWTVDAAGGYYTTARIPVEGWQSIQLEWRKSPGYFSFRVDGIQAGSPLIDFTAEQNPGLFRMGVVNADPDAYSGWLDFDEFGSYSDNI